MNKIALHLTKHEEGKTDHLVEMFYRLTGRRPTDEEIRDAMKEDHKFSTTQLQLPPDLALDLKALGKQIPDALLMDKGREDDPHITIKYGLETDDADDVADLVAQFGPIKWRLLNLDCFEPTDKDYDVVIIRVESDGLRQLNQHISETMKCTDTHPTYQPHATIAYVKRGEGKKWAARLSKEWMPARTMTSSDKFTFCDRQGNRTEIPLE